MLQSSDCDYFPFLKTAIVKELGYYVQKEMLFLIFFFLI